MRIYFDAITPDGACYLISFPVDNTLATLKSLKVHAKHLLYMQGIDISGVKILLSHGFNR